MLLHKRNFTLHCTRCTVEKVWAWFFYNSLKSLLLLERHFFATSANTIFLKFENQKFCIVQTLVKDGDGCALSQS